MQRLHYSASPEFYNVRDQAYRVRNGIDVLMPGGKRTGELQSTAKHICEMILKIYQKENEI